MSNSYYDHTTWPALNSSGSSSSAREELDKIEVGFDGIQSDLEDGSIWGSWTDEHLLAYNASTGKMESKSIDDISQALQVSLSDLENNLTDGSHWGIWTNDYVLAYNAAANEMQPKSISGAVGMDTGEVRLQVSDTMDYLLPKLQFMGLA